jgi:hypothetical protein
MGMRSLGVEIKGWLRGITGPLTIGGVVFGTMSQFLEITNLKPDGDNDNDGIPDIGDPDDDNDGYPDESDSDPYIWDPPKPPRDDEKDCPPSSWSAPPPSPCTWDFSTSPAKLKCPIGIYYWGNIMASQENLNGSNAISSFKFEILPTALFVVVLTFMVGFSSFASFAVDPVRKSIGVLLIAGFQIRLCLAYYRLAALLQKKQI